MAAVAVAVAAVCPLPPERCRELLAQYVQQKWQSRSFGPLLVVGTPENGVLRVWPATPVYKHEQHGFRFPLAIEATGTGVFLTVGAATGPFIVSGSESHSGSDVVWRNFEGSAEPWARIVNGCSSQESIEAGRAAMGRKSFSEAVQHFTA